MKNTFTFLQTALFVFATLVAQATDRETRSLDAFTAVSVSSGVDAKLVRGNQNEISISVDGIELDRVRTSIKGDKLIVSVKHKRSWFGSWKKKDIDVVITYTEELDDLSASSGSQLYADHQIVADVLDIDVSSGASVDLEVDAGDLDIDISSGSTAQIAGVADVAYVESSSGATLNAYDLIADKASTDGSSGSTIKISVVNSLKADVSSGASVRYKGNPENKDIDKGSGGSVRQVSAGI